MFYGYLTESNDVLEFVEKLIKMLFHYTSINALKGILCNPTSNQGLCFWATRFDCFGDDQEYKLGIDTIKRLLPKLEERLQPDRRIAHSFNYDEILKNTTIPFPYVVSFTDTNNSEFMWEHYAEQGKGIVLALDDSQRIVNEYTKHLFLRSCWYIGELTDDELYKEIEDEYFNAAFDLLKGPLKTFALTILAKAPQLFVVMIGRYLLSYVATRIKGERFQKEKETRVIYAAPRMELASLMEPYEEQLRTFPIDVEGFKDAMRSEKVRIGANGKSIFYQDIYLPGTVLKEVYIKDHSQLGMVEDVLEEKGFKKDVTVVAL